MVQKSKFNKRLLRLNGEEIVFDEEMKHVVEVLLDAEYYHFGAWKRIPTMMLHMIQNLGGCDLNTFANSIRNHEMKKNMIFYLKEENKNFRAPCKAHFVDYNKKYAIFNKLLDMLIDMRELRSIIQNKLDIVGIPIKWFTSIETPSVKDLNELLTDCRKISSLLSNDFAENLIPNCKIKEKEIDDVIKLIFDHI